MRILNLFYKKIIYKISTMLPIFVAIESNVSKKLRTLGDANGNWTFCHDNKLYKSTIISAGLGQNGSFEIDFANEYGTKIVIIDPTPKSKKYFDAHMSNYSYYYYLNEALYSKETLLPFYLPLDQNDVSHTLIANQLGYSDAENFTVKTTTINKLIATFDLDQESFKLLKLDIEGSEYNVLMGILDWTIKPEQILVEFDFLRVSLFKSRIMFFRVDSMLRRVGYSCYNRSNSFDFLYVLSVSTDELN
jgi:FkbM family methyltransferase